MKTNSNAVRFWGAEIANQIYEMGDLGLVGPGKVRGKGAKRSFRMFRRAMREWPAKLFDDAIFHSEYGPDVSIWPLIFTKEKFTFDCNRPHGKFGGLIGR